MQPDQKLLDYATRYLTKNHPGQLIHPQQAADFAAQVRRGCHQDMMRLLQQCIADTPMDMNGKDALRVFGAAIVEGGDIKAWGMPDCECGKSTCVYCSTGMAVPPEPVR